jgi:energy-coupling factor transporter ATP-binding protein EcfA2
MVEAGRSSHISVCSAREFEKVFFDFPSYVVLRKKINFGSAVDSKTLENDNRDYIPVEYNLLNKEKNFSIQDIALALQRGESVILSGDYGLGKSRCVREVFEILEKDVNGSAAFPLAINLREHWSSSSALEIIAGHLGNVGLSGSIDNIVRLLNSGNLILLLDGFDEIGTQIHDVRIDDRKALRKKAVQGVRDLIQRAKSGILITGRSHFFDSTEEMIESLGFSQAKNLLCLSVPDEFSLEEGKRYLEKFGINTELPKWLPRQPLVFQTLIELNREDIEHLLTHEHGQFDFWTAFLNAVCIRESRGVDGSIPPFTIQLILQGLAEKTRYSNSISGRLTPSDIDSAYQMVVGSVPDQSGRQLLSRMCTLGRIEPESPDRQFSDPNLLDILRADALVSEIVSMSEKSGTAQWVQSLNLLGIVHAAQVIYSYELEPLCFSYLRKYGDIQNTKRLGEIVSALCLFGNKDIDFKSLSLDGSRLPVLALNNRVVSNIIVKNSEIDILVLNNSPIKKGHGFLIDGCIISSVTGVTAQNGFPGWIVDSEAINFEAISNAARIKESPLSPPQKLCLAIIHKIFFQPGAGREESALLKGGYGQKYSHKLVEAILKILIGNDIVSKFKGRDGWVYTPERRYAGRMNNIISEMTLSNDPIWLEVSSLRY